MTPLLILLSVFTNQLYEARSYPEAKQAYLLVEEVEGILKRMGGELPVKLPEELLPVFWCESGMKQKVNGKIVRSKTNDIGIGQINLKSWAGKAKEMELDLYEKEDNIKFSIWLYEQYGLSPWRASKACHQKLT